MSTSEINWERIAERLQAEMAKLNHEEQELRYGNDFYAEALRRTFGYVAAGQPGMSGRALSYEYLQNGQGLTTEAQADWLLGSHTIVDKANLERAEKQLEEMRAELRRVYREAGKDLAAMLRERCNRRTVPSKYRRDGVAWAADMIDPSVPKDRFGSLIDPRDHAGLKLPCTPCGGPCRIDGEVAA